MMDNEYSDTDECVTLLIAITVIRVKPYDVFLCNLHLCKIQTPVKPPPPEKQSQILLSNCISHDRPEVRKLLLFYFYFFSTWS